jgi:tape measure domain-containing protein
MANANIDTKQAVAEINKLIESFNLLIKATGDVSTISTANFRKVETALAGLRTVSDQAVKSVDKMTDSQKQQLAASRAQARGLEAVATSAQEADKNTARLNETTKKTTSSFGQMLKGVKELIGAFGVVMGLQLFANIIKNAFELTKQFDSLAFALQKITKDSFDTASSQRFGVQLVATTERWIKFLAASKQAGVTLKDTEDIFRSVTKAGAVLGLKTEELQTVYLALEQMMSKGKVTTEELRRQLGEKLPGAIGIMAAAVGVNVNELDKMLKKGEVLSAEVLPKFARALETAYGITTVENINTVTAAQTRLTNAWQLFVKSITEDQDVITQTMNGMATIGQKIAGWFMSDEQKLQQKIISSLKDFQDSYEAQAETGYDRLVANEQKMWYIRSGIAQTQAALLEATGADKNKLNKELEQYQYQLAIGNEKILNIQKNRAKKEIEQAQANFKLKKEAYKQYQRDEEGDKEKIEQEYADATAKLEYLKKLLEVSTSAKFEDDNKPKEAKVIAKKYLDDIKDLENEKNKAILESRKKVNEDLLRSDDSSLQQMTNALVENGDIRLKLADTQRDEDLEKAADYYNKQIEELDRAKAEGKRIVGDEAKYRADLAKNYNDQASIANSKHNDAVLANEEQFGKDILAIDKRIEEGKIRMVDNEANRQIIAAKKVYNESRKTADDKKALDEALNKIAIEQANAVIDVQIATLEALKKIAEESGVATDKIVEQILKLQAAKKLFIPDEKEVKKAGERFREIMDYVSEVADAITDIGDALFDRKIENIEAEIRAESDKYDELIRLAKNNKDEQERLQVEKEAKLKELEAKKLKEQQRKAVFDKANALVQIAINTAVAASLVAAETGVGAFVTVPLIIALGALQAAAVIAQPIPKYMDGLDNAKSDHIGMINDGKDQEFIERGNSILTTSTKNAIVNLKKGDTVHKSYDDMLNGSDILKNFSRSILLSNLNNVNNDQATTMEIMLESQLKNLKGDIKKGIHEGFNKVTINNVTKVDLGWIAYKNDTL